MFEKSLIRFRRMALLTIAATIFLIGVGGLVRSTGSGMGCPDWPKCFGTWIPPTSIDDLPADYKAHYAALRLQKNKRIATRLQKMGFDEVAQKMTNDPKILIEEDFNVTKTWIEYINRLVGVLIGLFIFLTMLFSFSLRRLDWKITALSVVGFILVGLEGWLGSIVVSTNLMPGIITVHMLLAMILLVVLIIAYLSAKKDIVSIVLPKSLTRFGIFVTFLVLIQILLGTQVREAVDHVADMNGGENRGNWLFQIGATYEIHRSFYYVVVAAMLYWIFQAKKYFSQIPLARTYSLGLLLFTAAEVAMGIGMHYFSIPKILQPMHLLFSTLIFSSAFFLTATFSQYTKPVD